MKAKDNDIVLAIQKKLLPMIAWFHNFCVEHGLVYYALGGTLLGAVRHKGFIPWDDDADFGMPRKDYNKFIQLVKNNGSQYVGETIYDGGKNFTYEFCKIYDTSTTVVHKKKHSISRGLFIDVFPLDGLGNSKKEAIGNFKKFKRRDHFIAAKVTYKYNKKFGFFKNLGGMLLRVLPYNWRKAIIKIHKFCERIDYESSEYVGNCFGVWGTNEVVKREWMGEPILIDFENIQIYGPRMADEYLTNIYGDYMTPPPIEKRVPEHNFLYMDLEKSYLNNGNVEER